MPDEMLRCIQCDRPFLFTVKEQKRFEDNGFNKPKRCLECRRRKARMTEESFSWKDHRKTRKIGKSDKWYGSAEELY